MKTIIVCIALICLVNAAPKWHQLENYTFEQYVQDFQKQYVKGSAEYESRKQIFEEKLKAIKAHNNDKTQTYKKGINQYTDLSSEQFKNINFGHVKGMKAGIKSQMESQKLFLDVKPEDVPIDISTLPKQVDWRQQGVVSPVKDQGHCGSCWAFATVSVVESHAAIQSGKLKTLSPGQLVQCMPNTLQCGGQGGCNGAVAELGFNYIQLQGLTSEYKYPYTSYFGQTGSCNYNETLQTPEVTLDGYLRLPLNSYEHLLHAVATKGPIAISVDASHWHDYEEGVYSGCDVNQNVDINHAVVLVGYGSDENGDYWLVRNSWGTKWGEDGFIRVRRDTKPQCGSDNTPLDGTACAGQTQKQTVCGMCGILSDSAYPLGVRIIG